MAGSIRIIPATKMTQHHIDICQAFISALLRVRPQKTSPEPTQTLARES
jgi:hypothetical protein